MTDPLQPESWDAIVAHMEADGVVLNKRFGGGWSPTSFTIEDFRTMSRSPYHQHRWSILSRFYRLEVSDG